MLKTIADDKNYREFTSDSLISSVHSYYHRYNPHGDEHIRSLVYWAIVHYRMGEADSIVFAPLKEAENLYLRQKQPSPRTGYMLYYYLGDIHSVYGNKNEADIYFNKALKLAKQKGYSTHIFLTYLSLFWNEMNQKKFNSAATLLDSLQNYRGETSDNLFFLLNAQSMYEGTRGNYNKKLAYEKERIALVPFLKESPELFRLYFSLSDAYLNNNELDSAMYYAEKSIEHITDSTYKLNYLLYEKAAEIAQQQNNLSLALEYHKKALEVYKNNIDSQLDTQILELERKYDISEAKIKAMKAQRRSRMWLTTTVVVGLFLLLIVLYVVKQRAIAHLRQQKATEKALRLQLEKEQMEREAERLQKMAEVSARFFGEHAEFQEQARKMANKIRAKESKLGEEYEQMLKEGQSHFSDLASELFTATKLKERFGLDKDLEIFSQSDRLFLIMLSANAPTAQIAAMLNTTPHNLKTRKSYLKAKIEKHATEQNNFAQLLTLFSNKKTI